MQTDKIFYSLFQAFPNIFFAIIGDTTGLSVEQVAVALDLTVAQVQQADHNQSG